jgi:hypothetical protein
MIRDFLVAFGGASFVSVYYCRAVPQKKAGCSSRIKLAPNNRSNPMNLTEVTIDGTIKPDGTLELDSKPELSPGRVKVVLRQEIGTRPTEGWWAFMQNVRKRMDDAGCRLMDEKEMQAHVEWLREEDRIDEMLREMTEQP